MRCTVHWLILRQSTILSSLRNRRSAPLPPLARAFSRIPLPLHARLAVLWHRFRAHGWRHSSLRREFFLVGPPSGADCLQALLLHPPRFTVLASPPMFHSPSAVASHLSGIRLSWDKLLVGFSMSEPVAPIADQPSAQRNMLLVGFSMSEPVAPIADQPSAQRNMLLVGFSMSEPVAPIADQPSAQRNMLLVGFSTLNRRHFSSFQRALAIPQTPALLAFIWAFRERLVRRNIFWTPLAVI